ncbi:MAG: cytochrome c maturation protein CcmE [Deltaproteobacteria bacterium]|nr:cytochrome c maturation protein CcmE [Deltaproteobacteria bacterium]
MKRKIRYIIPLLLIGGVIGYLFSSAFRSAIQYYVTVAELQAAPPPPGRILKVGGTVKSGTLTQTGSRPVTYQFTVAQGDDELPVRYTGMVPDTFKEGGEVVATGTLGADGTFEATHILAKCASKYEAKAP